MRYFVVIPKKKICRSCSDQLLTLLVTELEIKSMFMLIGHSRTHAYFFSKCPKKKERTHRWECNSFFSFFYRCCIHRKKFTRIAVQYTSLQILDMRILLLCHWCSFFLVKLFRFHVYIIQPTFGKLHATPKKVDNVVYMFCAGMWVWVNWIELNVIWIHNDVGLKSSVLYPNFYRFTWNCYRSTILHSEKNFLTLPNLFQNRDRDRIGNASQLQCTICMMLKIIRDSPIVRF